MLHIRTAEALARAIETAPDTQLRHLLAARADRLADYPDYDLSDLAEFLIVRSGDDIESLDQALGWSLLAGETFAKPVELIARHSGWYEVTFILSDDGFGLVLFVHRNADSSLIAACEQA